VKLVVIEGIGFLSLGERDEENLEGGESEMAGRRVGSREGV
jgi:hypothetical protein